MSDKRSENVGLSIFTAIVVVLQLLGSFIKIGTFSFSLVLIPIVVGAAVYGPGAGAFLGGVFGAVVTIACANGSDYGGSILFTANPFLTIFICMLKGILAGAAAGGVYNLAAKKTSIWVCFWLPLQRLLSIQVCFACPWSCFSARSW